MEKLDTSGFYKFDGEKWFYAPNAVYNLNYIILKEDKDTYEYPIDGWVWSQDSPEEYLIWIESDKE